MARRELLAGIEICRAVGALDQNLAAMGERDDQARLLRCPELKFEPVADVLCREGQPRFHASTAVSSCV
jgi:hypothetical protein